MEETTIRGIWWLDGKPDAQFPGTLFISPDRIRLEITGFLRSENNREMQTILGIANDCSEWTLLKVFETSLVMSVNPLQVMHVNMAIKGLHASSADEIAIDNATFSLPRLEQSLSEKHSLELFWNDSNQLASVVLPPIQQTEISIDSHNMKLLFSSRYEQTSV